VHTGVDMFTVNLLMQFSLTLTNSIIEIFLFRDDVSKHNCNCTTKFCRFLTSKRDNIAPNTEGSWKNINNMQLRHWI